MEWVWSSLKNFLKGRGEYCNSETFVIIYVLFVATELYFDNIFLPNSNIKIKNYKDFKNSKPLSLNVSKKVLAILKQIYIPISPYIILTLTGI